jgi:type IV secretory pathway VirB10-like protein
MKSRTFSHQDRFAKPNRPWIVALLGLAVVFLSGCAEKQVKVRPWAASINVRPNVPVAVPAYQPHYVDDSAPDLAWDFPPPPSSLTVARQPARPRAPAQQPSESIESRQPTAPSLAPELSPQEIAAAQSQMNESVAIAQKNLGATRGRALNPTQSDLASKVTSFLQESKDAARDGDWTRARNLAKKAQVLSEELGALL